jgi:hypothetical protein
VDVQWCAHSIHLLALEHEFISTLTVFKALGEPSLFQAFGLPLILREAPGTEAASTLDHILQQEVSMDTTAVTN